MIIRYNFSSHFCRANQIINDNNNNFALYYLFIYINYRLVPFASRTNDKGDVDPSSDDENKKPLPTINIVRIKRKQKRKRSVFIMEITRSGSSRSHFADSRFFFFLRPLKLSRLMGSGATIFRN